MITSRVILIVGLFLIDLRYASVLIEGYDIFEGNNDPEVGWIDYVTYGALGFEIARHKSCWWSIGAAILLAVVSISLRWLLLIFAWADRLGWEFVANFPWRHLILSMIIELIVLVAGAVMAGLVGALLYSRLVQRRLPHAAI